MIICFKLYNKPRK